MKTIKDFNGLVSEIQQKSQGIREWVEQYESIVTSIKSVEIAPLKISASDIELDVSSTIRLWKDKGITRYEAMKRLEQTLEIANKYTRYAGTGTANQRRTTLTADILAATRDSARFKGMANSATKGGDIESEEDFFYRVVADAVSNLRGVNKASLITQLNARLEEKGYPTVNKTFLNSYTK